MAPANVAVASAGLGAAAVGNIALHCYYIDQGWWTYELCPGHHVRQFHVLPEQNGIESAVELGIYDVQV